MFDGAEMIKKMSRMNSSISCIYVHRLQVVHDHYVMT
jgi:hypothetical protein